MLWCKHSDGCVDVLACAHPCYTVAARKYVLDSICDIIAWHTSYSGGTYCATKASGRLRRYVFDWNVGEMDPMDVSLPPRPPSPRDLRVIGSGLCRPSIHKAGQSEWTAIRRNREVSTTRLTRVGRFRKSLVSDCKCDLRGPGNLVPQFGLQWE